ncbi:YicC/YloC family endoribonuclease [Alysiella filiformis]|uniref:TIGR00255 family protein n=1 Tax=Alysiella filiformis DSM 16848 TaxID=1120981 RepID=A0A286E4Z5_9NEIS|nr:YicC/YloC family endoribonuclease [Alysiella filiformis]QMT30440.1 YicC family protein [Alysiella filiformis]UBQ56579.1 YicC family protein [Alysiella filiformis DSM 16848]SOD65944.1 TIGR00255 family protein [Alysiella filiformis DSM 16848]
MTIKSMTGFAHTTGESSNTRIDLEIRAVNHRFLDVQFKMPDDLRYLESAMREQIAQHVTRGKIECRIQLSNIGKHSGSLHINEELVDELAALNAKWRDKHASLGKLTVAEILKFPNVIVSAERDTESLGEHVLHLLNHALLDFVATRQREGVKLQAHLLERLELMDDLITALESLFPSILQSHIQRARARLGEAILSIDDDRLKQEFALFMQKADVDEEFSRLRTHIAEVRRLITEHKGTVGKRLDFLMQELNREANTLGSKSIASECTQVSVELKVLIEQMREQVQNIE